MSDMKARRTALGWSRADLAVRAKVDPRVVQLLELGLSSDDESAARCTDALSNAEKANSTPENPTTEN